MGGEVLADELNGDIILVIEEIHVPVFGHRGAEPFADCVNQIKQERFWLLHQVDDGHHLLHLNFHHLKLKTLLALDLTELAASSHLHPLHETPPDEHVLEEGDGERVDDCKSHSGADVQVEEQVAHQLWAQPEFYLPILVSPIVCLYKIAAFKVGMALITRQAGFLLLVAFHITFPFWFVIATLLDI